MLKLRKMGLKTKNRNKNHVLTYTIYINTYLQIIIQKYYPTIKKKINT